MKILFLCSVFFAAQFFYSAANEWSKTALEPSKRNWNSNPLRSGNTVIVKPKLWLRKNLFGFKNKGRVGQLNKDSAAPNKFRIKGTAALKNGNLKLDLTLDPANGKLQSLVNVHFAPAIGSSSEASTTPMASTQPTSAITSGPTTAVTSGPASGTTIATTAPVTTKAVGTSTTAGGSTSGTGATSTSQPTSASSGPPSTLVTSAATSGPSTTAVPSGPTSGPTLATTGPTAGTTLASTTVGVTSASGGPTTPGGATSGVTTTATLAPPTTLGSSSTSAPTALTLPTSKPTSPAGVTTISTSAQTTGSVVTTSVMPTSKPSGALPNKICLIPGKVYVIIIAKAVMNAHNAYRRTHGSPDLQLDEQMICDAQKFAQNIAFKGVLQHQSSAILARKGLGENIGMSCTPARNGPLNYDKITRMVRNVAKRWYDEVCEYNFDKPNYAAGTGHFTEVVWSGSKKLGVGFAVGKNAKFPGYVCVYVVGRYSPAGNNIGAQRLETNVKRGNFNEAYCKRRSKAPSFTLIPVDKRNHLKNKLSHAARK